MKRTYYFLLPYFIFLLTGIALMSLFSKAEFHLYINSFHHPLLDRFFRFSTHIGDGLFVVAVVFLLAFIRHRYALLLGMAYIVSALIAQFFKKMIFPGYERPKKFFEGMGELYYVPGVELHAFNTFPSGHATTAFTLFFCLALIVRSNTLKLLFFIAALVVAFSRVYLSQHFFMDIYFGSFIGIVSTFVVYYTIQNSRILNQTSWIDQSLLTTVFKRK